MYDELELDSLDDRRKILNLILFYEMTHGLPPEYLKELLIPIDKIITLTHLDTKMIFNFFDLKFKQLPV